MTLFPFVTKGGIHYGDKKSSFPFSTIGIKYVGSFEGLSYRPHSIPMTFHDEFGFLVAQFNSPYLLHSSSYEFSHRTWVFHSPIFCAITVPNFPSVEKSSHECFSHECGGLWPHLAF